MKESIENSLGIYNKWTSNRASGWSENDILTKANEEWMSNKKNKPFQVRTCVEDSQIMREVRSTQVTIAQDKRQGYLNQMRTHHLLIHI